MIKTIFSWLYVITLCFLFTVYANADETELDVFEISITSIDASHATVTAQLDIPNGRVVTGGGGSYDWIRGWADFVSDVSAVAADGQTLTVSEGGESFDAYWQLSADGKLYQGSVTLSYKVDLSYTRTEWDFGNEQAGRVYRGGLYSVTKPLFMSGDPSRGAEVHFKLPRGWDIAAPWRAVDGKIHTYYAEDWQALENNAITVGKFERARASANGFDLEIVLLGDFEGAPPLVVETIEQVLPVYLDLFAGTPSSKYMMFYLNGQSEDAEAFKNGAAFTTTLNLSSNNRIFWADFLAHELFHFWNGQRIRAEDRSRGNWFSEGFTDYYANLVLVNRSVLSEDWFRRRMENIFGNYLWFHSSGIFEGLSVLEAGIEKGRNRFGIYDAGWVLAFALDDEIRTRSSGEKSLDDAMKAIYERYGKTGERYEVDDLIATMSTATDLDLSDYFDLYLKTRTPLPLKEIMKTFGWTSYSNNYANEYYLIRDEKADSNARSKWDHLLNKRFE